MIRELCLWHQPKVPMSVRLLSIPKPHNVFLDEPVVRVGFRVYSKITKRNITNSSFLSDFDNDPIIWNFAGQSQNLHFMPQPEWLPLGNIREVRIVIVGHPFSGKGKREIFLKSPRPISFFPLPKFLVD